MFVGTPTAHMTQTEIATEFRPTVAPAVPARKERVRFDSDLVQRARAGDEDALGEIYRGFSPLVHGIALSRLPYDEVQDIVQDVFISAFKNLHTLRDPGAVGPWLAMITRNRTVEYYRQSRPSEELQEELRGKNDQRAEALEVLTTIRTLPESYRETLILRLVEGMTGNEIADRTGLSPDSVRVNLHRGMGLLREKLGISGAKR
ncbi:MAG: RNA polymerase sigma factor [Pyrinomonadaceae bacterium]